MNLNKLQKEVYYALGEILTEGEVSREGGGSLNSNECCTKSKAGDLNCTVSGSFASNELIDNATRNAPPTVVIHIVEVCIDAPGNYWGTATTSIGYSYTSGGCYPIEEEHAVQVPAGASMSAHISGAGMDMEVYGTVPTDITEGNYRWMISFVSQTMTFESM